MGAMNAFDIETVDEDTSSAAATTAFVETIFRWVMLLRTYTLSWLHNCVADVMVLQEEVSAMEVWFVPCASLIASPRTKKKEKEVPRATYAQTKTDARR